MKKTFVRLGVLAAALALIFVACAQPTEESSSGPNAPTIVRLHLDKQGTVAFAGSQFEIRIGEELYIAPAGSALPNRYLADIYPYGLVPGQNDNKTTANPLVVSDRNKVLAIPGSAARTSLLTVLQTEGKKKYLASGVIQAVDGVGTPVNDAAITASGLIQTDNKDKTQRYIDIELVDVKANTSGYGSVYSGSISGYLELAVSSTHTAGTTGLLADTIYLYTKDKHGFNDFLRNATAADFAANPALIEGTPVYGVKNANIKKVSLKPGINDIYLSFFSYQQFNQ